MVRVAELVDQPLTSLRLLHDPLLVVLSQGPGQLVVVHGGTVLIRNILLKAHISYYSLSPFSFPTVWRPWRNPRSWRFPWLCRSSECSCRTAKAAGEVPSRTARDGCLSQVWTEISVSQSRPPPPPHLENKLSWELNPGATLNKHCVVVRGVVTLSGKQDSQFSGYQVRLRCNLIMVIENIILPFWTRNIW